MLIAVLTMLVSMPLAGRMANTRHRSFRAWVWATALIGPLALLILCLLGNRRQTDRTPVAGSGWPTRDPY